MDLGNKRLTESNRKVSVASLHHCEKLTYSPACWIQNLPWKIFIEPVVQSGKKYLSVYVGCTQSGIEHWTCRAVVEIYKLFGLTPKIIRANTGLIFDSAASTSWGHISLCSGM
ncbi:hypothetical protein WA026_011350 [Henosepilachna vigintioctopunctata]|uniref:Integrase catalytic domain-containing protein n=1 Tax=Henosepilachna vigintioctopunctata TaxID=420089 RepID=A0AAW1TKN2_9CUCU